MKKRVLSVLMGLCLTASMMPAAASAETVCLSEQALTVDGNYVQCQKYNIDGYNYFMLRDMADALKDTSYCFDVSYDAETNSVVATAGIRYTGEASAFTGEDKSGTAVRSEQTLIVNGIPCVGTSVYNIGGNNYFKLRDLGEIFGFSVGYDAGTNVAKISTTGVIDDTDSDMDTDDPLEGVYTDSWSGRAELTLEPNGDGTYYAFIYWSDGWNAGVVWNMNCTYDAAAGRLSYSDCTEKYVTTDDNGEGTETDLEITSPVGYFDVVMGADGNATINWTGSVEDYNRECNFVLDGDLY